MKISSAFLFGLILILFSSCSDDESNPSGPAISVPSLEFISSDSTVFTNDTLEAGAQFGLGFTGRKGPVDLVSWTLSLNNVDLPDYTNVPVSSTSAFTEVIMDLEAPLISGNYIYTLSLTDMNNISVQNSLTITVLEDANIDETSIEIIRTDSTVFSDTTLAFGTSFNIHISAIQGFYKMESWSILLDATPITGFSEIPVPDDSSFSTNIENIPLPGIEGVYTYTFQVKNTNGDIADLNWEVTALDIPTFTEYKNIILGAQTNSSFGSFFLARTVTVSTLSEANASNGEAVEFFYYNGATNGPTLYSPIDPDADSFYGGAINNWFIRFSTQLQKTTLNYSNVTALEVDESPITGTKASQLLMGDVILFETPLGTKGILKITSLATGNSGSITFDTKIID